MGKNVNLRLLNSISSTGTTIHVERFSDLSGQISTLVKGACRREFRTACDGTLWVHTILLIAESLFIVFALWFESVRDMSSCCASICLRLTRRPCTQLSYSHCHSPSASSGASLPSLSSFPPLPTSSTHTPDQHQALLFQERLTCCVVVLSMLFALRDEQYPFDCLSHCAIICPSHHFIPLRFLLSPLSPAAVFHDSPDTGVFAKRLMWGISIANSVLFIFSIVISALAPHPTARNGICIFVLVCTVLVSLALGIVALATFRKMRHYRGSAGPGAATTRTKASTAVMGTAGGTAASMVALRMDKNKITTLNASSTKSAPQVPAA